MKKSEKENAMFRQALSATLTLTLTASLFLQACGKGPTPVQPPLVPTPNPSTNNLPGLVTATGCAAQGDVDTDGDLICDKVDKQIGAGCENNPDCNNDGITDDVDDDNWYKNAWTFLLASSAGAVAALTLRSGLDCGNVNPFKGCFWNGDEPNSQPTSTTSTGTTIEYPGGLALLNSKFIFKKNAANQPYFITIQRAGALGGNIKVAGQDSGSNEVAYCIGSLAAELPGSVSDTNGEIGQTLQLQGQFKKSYETIPTSGINMSNIDFESTCESANMDKAFVQLGKVVYRVNGGAFGFQSSTEKEIKVANTRAIFKKADLSVKLQSVSDPLVETFPQPILSSASQVTAIKAIVDDSGQSILTKSQTLRGQGAYSPLEFGQATD